MSPSRAPGPITKSWRSGARATARLNAVAPTQSRTSVSVKGIGTSIPGVAGAGVLAWGPGGTWTMAKGYEANKERQAAIAGLGKALAKRAKFKCEWCEAGEDLRPVDLDPAAEPSEATL